MTTPTPAERRAVAEIVLPKDASEYYHDDFTEGRLRKDHERVVLADGLLRARIAASYGMSKYPLDGSKRFVEMGQKHACLAEGLGTFFHEKSMLDALWACALAHVREVERRKAKLREDAKALPFPIGTRVVHEKFGPGIVTDGPFDNWEKGEMQVTYDCGFSKLTPTRFLAPKLPPEPRRFFPGERVRVNGVLCRVCYYSDKDTIQVSVIGREHMGYSVNAHDLAPETAARVIPYGDTRCPR